MGGHRSALPLLGSSLNYSATGHSRPGGPAGLRTIPSDLLGWGTTKANRDITFIGQQVVLCMTVRENAYTDLHQLRRSECIIYLNTKKK